jgi:hypothetical protein
MATHCFNYERIANLLQCNNVQKVMKMAPRCQLFVKNVIDCTYLALFYSMPDVLISLVPSVSLANINAPDIEVCFLPPPTVQRRGSEVSYE